MNQSHESLVLAQSTSGTGSKSVEIIFIALCIFELIGLALTFSKAGKPWWGAFIPIYNIVLLLRVAQRPLWWIILLMIPLVNVVVFFVVSVDIARAFGKGSGFGWGLACLGFIFYPILGFGQSPFIATADGDTAGGPNRTALFQRMDPITKKHFDQLGVSIVENYQHRAINVGFARGSGISNDDLPALIPLGLSELYLSRTKISDESIAHFQKMPQLRVLDVSHTNLSRQGINQLNHSLPNTNIIG
ncbi:hypothetical protein CA54_58230 [Symmachiella macrocystis]|uniref:Leucine Rich repeats (2 copies) n=1 Tax=Symmachiella macrocystis TaxID=2527985 RepID=A0A5C6AYL0_9PLAN|nr:DUF5684 domain-containing protein [Symmachiella macrocystis]TWU05135.1 hypothetical protein CA54_58230 [Symmachiella macrocystis]